MSGIASDIADEIGAAAGIDAGEINALCARITAAGRIVLYGCGREGLQMRGFTIFISFGVGTSLTDVHLDGFQ